MEKHSQLADLVKAINNNMQEIIKMQDQLHEMLIQSINRPKSIKYGPDGKITGVE